MKKVLPKIVDSFVLFILLISIDAFSQNKEHPKDYFRSPLDIPITLSGNFGELRSNHFHAGFDIKTEGVEGKKIYAVADGYVSRIKVSPWGYGNALYITHPNGYVSVYAHLKNYNDSIQKYVRAAQYRNETFEVELLPAVGELMVKKGDVVAFSGNTGGSGGPHLHFEIRDEKTERPINPLLFGYKVLDNVKPVLKDIIIYPLDSSSFVNFKRTPKKISLSGTHGNYGIGQGTTVVLQGNIGFGIEAYDLNSSVSNKVGVYSIELKVDNERIYYYEMEQFAFDESRYINCHIDYYECKKNKSFFQKSFIVPNNKLPIYKNIKNNGIWNFSDDSVHTVEYLVKDYSGNASTVAFKVKSQSKDVLVKESSNAQVEKPLISPWFKEVFKFDRENVFKNDYVTVELPPHIFYEDLYFDYHFSDTIKGAITATHHIHNSYVPVHASYALSIKIDSIAPVMRRKALIVSIDEKGMIAPMGGTLRRDMITCNPKILGAFTVMIDSVAPVIKPLNIPADKNLAGAKEIKIKISDNLSGIKTYRATINEKWIIMEYDPKQALLTYTFEKDITPGFHVFQLEVKDGSGNTALYTTEFTR